MLSADQCSPSPFAGRRAIAYYGTCLGPGLGILGRYGLNDTLALLNEQIQPYRELDPSVETVPVLHMVVTIADAFPGEDGNYNHRVDHATIQAWIDGGRAAGAWSILDIQPAISDLDTEISAVEPLLMQSGVYLAVDPEFMVDLPGVPGTQLGHITGPEINYIQARLDAIAGATGERQVLVIHQFNDRMVRGKECIVDFPCVDLVWDADGFGGPGAKMDDYLQYRFEPGFELGAFKIFYRYDTPVMTVEQVLGLEPRPVLVIYQ